MIAGDAPGEVEGAINPASLAELHLGVLVAASGDERARRAQGLGVVEATFDPSPIDAAVAREWERLATAIAATVNVAGVPLLTRDADDLRLIGDLVDARAP